MAKLGKALMSLLLDKKAREALEAKAAAPARAQEQRTQEQRGQEQRGPQTPHPSQDEIYARLEQAQQASQNRVNSPSRQQLIDEARRVRTEKAKMLDDLPEDQRRRLKAMAMMSFMKMRP